MVQDNQNLIHYVKKMYYILQITTTKAKRSSVLLRRQRREDFLLEARTGKVRETLSQNQTQNAYKRMGVWLK
jgi:hypothetical protein